MAEKKINPKVLKNIKKQNGITLIALVITIIVLIIFTSASISLIINENGLFSQARNAKMKNEFARVQDEIMLKINENIFRNYNIPENEKINASTYLFNEGYIDYTYKLDMNKLGVEGLTLGYGSFEKGDYYSIKDEKLTYVDANKNSTLIVELIGIGKIPVNLYFGANINQENIQFDINMEKTIKLTLNNYQEEDVTYEDIVYEISMKNRKNSLLDVIIEGVNLSQENYNSVLKGNQKQLKETDLQIKVKNGKSLTNETIELEVKVKEPLAIQKVLKINISNDNLVDYSGNNYHGKLMNGLKIERDEENNCAMQFDGIDDFIQLPTISGGFNWGDGFNIEVVATVEDLNKNTGILTLGNGADQDHIILQAVQDGNKIKFEAQGKRELTIYHKNYSNNNSLQLNKKTNIKASMYTNLLKKYQSEIKFDDVKKSENGTGEMYKTVTPVRGVDRTQNYIGKSYWNNGEYFKGKIYYLKVTDGSGKKIIEYDLNHM